MIGVADFLLDVPDLCFDDFESRSRLIDENDEIDQLILGQV